MELRLTRNLPDYNNPPTLHLRGVADTDETASKQVSVYYRVEGETDFQLLGHTVQGQSLRIPISITGPIELAAIAFSEDAGQESSGADLSKATRTTFTPPDTPVLESLAFDSGNEENDLVIASNGGTGDINIHRLIDDEPFGIIDSVSPATTAYSDPVTLDGDYAYKLTQDGVTGESNTRTVTVSGVSGGAGSPPSGLDATHDGLGTSSLTWTNNGGTGNNIIERKVNASGSWATLATVSSATSNYDDASAFAGTFNRTYYYRVRNESVAGYSNEAQVFVEAAG